MLADSHCHLNEFKNVAEQVKKAANAGVLQIVSNSVDLESMQENLKIAKSFKEVQCALGLHPSNVLRMSSEEIEQALAFMEKNAVKCIAIGETGLDFKHAETEPQRAKQRELFTKQIELAKELDKPVIVHSRMARAECVKLLAEYNAEKVLMHWFVASDKLLQKVNELGYFISVGPSILFNGHICRFLEKVPIENLLLETDAPVSYNGKRAEPFWIKSVAEKVASVLQISLEEVEERTSKNFSKLFES